MISIPKLVKNIEIKIGELFKLFLGNDIDEYNEPYRNVYKSEIYSFLDNIELNMDKLVKSNVTISYIEIRNAILSEWNIGILNKGDLIELNNFCSNLYDISLRDENRNNLTIDTNLSKEENSFIESCLSEAMRKSQNFLITIHLKEDKFYDQLMTLDEKKYEDLIESAKRDYIYSTNLLYKLYNKSPKDWSTGYSIHNAIIKAYNLNKSDFLMD